MKITTITYSRLAVTQRYENERIEATAVLTANEDPDRALKKLRKWVISKTEKNENQDSHDPYECPCGEYECYCERE